MWQSTPFAPLLFLLLGGLSSPVNAFEYTLTSVGDISVTDNATQIGDLKVLFNGDTVLVSVSDLAWEDGGTELNSTDATLFWETGIGDTVQSSGSYDMLEFGMQLPSALDVGHVSVDESGSHTVFVRFSGVTGVDADQSVEADRTYQSYAAGVSIIPLIVVLVMAMTTQMVEFSLFCTVFIGSCMIAGDIKGGFFATLDTYILENLADIDHGYVYLFSLFLSGLVSMLQKSGGMTGFTQWISQYAKTARAAQVSIFCVTCLCFFDDYTNLLLTGQSMASLSDLLGVSKEKFTFLVDATAAPLASLTPVSSWVGFEVSLIQTELDKLIAIYGDDLTISASAINIFLQSIRYRYYPIFMLCMIPAIIGFQRDFGLMLIAERKVRVRGRTDGGEGKLGDGVEGADDLGGNENKPRDDIPKRTFNMLVPVLLLIFFIFFLMIRTGNDGSGDQSFTEKIENSDSFSALLWGTMATALLTTIMYAVQIVQDGQYVLPSLPVLKNCLFAKAKNPDEGSGEEVEEEVPSSPATSLMSIYESTESFLFGMGRLFPALIVLTLAWATGDIMTSVGADRLFSKLITEGVNAEVMPTLAFVIAVIMALATGSSWSTMTILFPLIMVPTYEVARGDELIFYSTVAGVLSGSVAGDHMSPISDTTVISAMSCRCKLLNHVVTQAPYSLMIILLCILFGTIPIGRDAMPNIVCILLGAVATVGLVFFLGSPVTNKTGRYDIITELFLKCFNNEEYEALREETIAFNDKSGICCCGYGEQPDDDHPELEDDADNKDDSPEKMDETDGEEKPGPLQTGMSSSLLEPGEAHA